MSQENNSNVETKSVKKSHIFSSLIAALHAKKMVIIGLFAVSALFGLIFWSLYSRTYTVSVLIYPSQTSRADLSPGGSEAEINSNHALYDPDFETYHALLRSPNIQMQVLRKNYTIEFDFKSYSIDLARYFGMKNISYALQELNDITEISYIDNARILKLSVTTKYPDLSRQIARAYLNELEKRLDQLRRENISDEIDQLDQALQFIEDHESVTDSARNDLIGRLQTEKGMILLAGRLNPVKPGIVREGYIWQNGAFSETAVVSIPLVIGLAAVFAVPGAATVKSQKRIKAAPVQPGRMSQKSRAESILSQSKQRSARKTIPKTPIRNKTRMRRAVKV